MNETVDIITGGFPCQPFSTAGKRRGSNDDRALWPEMLRVISEFNPTWVIGENVAGIINMELDNVLASLENENYQTQTFVIPACAINAPHRRDRVWIVANSYEAGRKAFIGEHKCQRNEETANINKNREKICAGVEGFGESYSWRDIIPRLCRMDDGISTKLDKIRLGSLGNAVVPQIVCEIGKAILKMHYNNE